MKVNYKKAMAAMAATAMCAVSMTNVISADAAKRVYNPLSGVKANAVSDSSDENDFLEKASSLELKDDIALNDKIVNIGIEKALDKEINKAEMKENGKELLSEKGKNVDKIRDFGDRDPKNLGNVDVKGVGKIGKNGNYKGMSSERDGDGVDGFHLGIDRNENNRLHSNSKNTCGRTENTSTGGMSGNYTVNENNDIVNSHYWSSNGHITVSSATENGVTSYNVRVGDNYFTFSGGELTSVSSKCGTSGKDDLGGYSTCDVDGVHISTDGDKISIKSEEDGVDVELNQGLSKEDKDKVDKQKKEEKEKKAADGDTNETNSDENKKDEKKQDSNGAGYVNPDDMSNYIDPSCDGSIKNSDGGCTDPGQDSGEIDTDAPIKTIVFGDGCADPKKDDVKDNYDGSEKTFRGDGCSDPRLDTVEIKFPQSIVPDFDDKNLF